MRFDILSIFPTVFGEYFSQSILKRAQEIGSVTFHVHDIRHWARDRHRTVDDAPYGGGAGMVMKVEPIFDAVEQVLAMSDEKRERTRVILLSAKGIEFTQRIARRLSQDFDRIVFICGRYEGVDERVVQYIADEEISIGKYVLTGGELPAMVVVDAVSRLLPSVLGNSNSLNEESHNDNISSEYPQYTRPGDFRGWKVPDVLLGGDHAKIRLWREVMLHRSSKGTDHVDEEVL